MTSEAIRTDLGNRRELTVSGSYAEAFVFGEEPENNGYDSLRDGFYLINATGASITINDNATDTVAWYEDNIPNKALVFIPWPGKRLFIKGSGAGKVKVQQVIV